MEPTIETISASLINGFPTLSPGEQQLVGAVLGLLATGRAASPVAIAAKATWSLSDVEAWLAAWPAVVRDDDGAVVGFLGLSADAVTRHRMDFEGLGTAWAWCAEDSLFLAPLLGATATVTSRCPTTGDPIGLTVSPEGVFDVDPASACLTLMLLDGPFDDNIRQTACQFIHFFASPDAAATWVVDHPGTFAISLSDGFEVARRWNLALFPALVGAQT